MCDVVVVSVGPAVSLSAVRVLSVGSVVPVVWSVVRPVVVVVAISCHVSDPSTDKTPQVLSSPLPSSLGTSLV